MLSEMCHDLPLRRGVGRNPPVAVTTADDAALVAMAWGAGATQVVSAGSPLKGLPSLLLSLFPPSRI